MTLELKQEIQFVNDDGTITLSRIDDVERFSEMPERAEAIKELFESCCEQVECVYMDVPDAFRVTGEFDGEEFNYVLGVDAITPPGNNRSPSEYRVQPRGLQINYIFNQGRPGIDNFWLCIYKRQDKPVYCAWKSRSTTSRESNALYKVDASTIAKAMRDGFAIELRNRKKTAVCAFTKEYLPLFLRNREALFYVGESDSAQTVDDEPRVNLPHNLIVFGAPGTGKSFKVKQLASEFFPDDDQVCRVTFHPDYTYARFVGSYKPYWDADREIIGYRFAPGPFTETYVKAVMNPSSDFLLVIEEINRANPAAAFGDVFQLLDRKNGRSEYPITAQEDLREYLEEQFPQHLERYAREISIPPNMYIWATMNSADQGVFPMDTAFKRRWVFDYIPIDNNSDLADRDIDLESVERIKWDRKSINWDKARRRINSALLDNCRVNEDKLLGPFFIDLDCLDSPESFVDSFESKVLLYLIEDAAKMRPAKLFTGIKKSSSITYSLIRLEFEKNGMEIFGNADDEEEL